eukprot:5404277-Amphidinium_carterae.1
MGETNGQNNKILQKYVFLDLVVSPTYLVLLVLGCFWGGLKCFKFALVIISVATVCCDGSKEDFCPDDAMSASNHTVLQTRNMIALPLFGSPTSSAASSSLHTLK